MADNGCPSGDCGGTQNEDDDATNLLETTALLDGTPAASLSKDRRIGKGNNHNVDEKSSLWGCWLRNRYLLPIVATMNTPPYTMGICISLFSTAAYLSRDARTARTLLALYLVYCLGDPTPKRLQKPRWVRLVQKWCNDSWFFRWTAEHFPCCLHKTASIDACRGPYVFAYHPHGVIGMGVNMTLNTNARQFDALFPGIDRSAVTLNICFWCPFFRDWMLLNGFCSADKRTLLGRLRDGESLVLVPGGAREALLTHPKTMKLALKRRRGFVKLAVETGAGLVPCLGFGENDVFDTHGVAGTSENGNVATTNTSNAHGHHRWISKLQHWFMGITSFSLPIWTNLIPNRTPIHVVVGKPIRFPNDIDGHTSYEGRSQQATAKCVDECHALYVKALCELYEENKHKYGYGNVPLEIV